MLGSDVGCFRVLSVFRTDLIDRGDWQQVKQEYILISDTFLKVFSFCVWLLMADRVLPAELWQSQAVVK